MMKYAFARTVATVVLALLTVLLMAAAASICLSSCRASRPATDEAAAPVHQGVPAAQLPRADSAAGLGGRTPDTNPLQTAATPDKAKPPLLTRIFSTPEGTARRQARKNARAAVPRTVKVKDGAFAWGPGAVATNVSGNKEPAAVGAGATVTNAEKKAQQQSAVGDGNTQEQTPPPPAAGFNWAWLWLLLIPGGWLVYKNYKRIPFLG